MSDKYIIRNCPAILKMTKVCDDYRTTRDNPELCKNIKDCLLKQIVDECFKAQRECNCYDIIPEVDCVDCTDGGKNELATEILDLLDIQEVE